MAAGAAAAAALAVAGLSGCAQMDKSLGQQWLVVQFSPNTTVAKARDIVRTCSHVPNLTPGKVQPTSGASGIADQIQYNATNASDANQADLETCLQRFSHWVQGENLLDSGDMGS